MTKIQRWKWLGETLDRLIDDVVSRVVPEGPTGGTEIERLVWGLLVGIGDMIQGKIKIDDLLVNAETVMSGQPLRYITLPQEKQSE